MAQRVLVVGASAAGPKAACRIKRLDRLAQVTVIDRDNLFSYAGCGIPYFVGGDVADAEGLRSTFAHVLRDCAYFEKVKDVEIRPRIEAVAIDRKNKTVAARSIEDGKEEILPYDKLVLATGSKPVVPDVEGIDLPGVIAVSNLRHAMQIKDRVSKGMVESAVVIGGGAKGIELAEALTDLWGVETTLVEKEDRVLPSALGDDMALLIQNHLEQSGVRTLLSRKLKRIVGDQENGVTAVETETETIPCDLVIVAAGTLPNASLAREAGLAIGQTGGIAIDERTRTSDPDIYAGGDCVELTHLVSGRKVHMPMGSLATLQGRVIGTNIAGGRALFKGTVSFLCMKVFGMAVARAGLTVEQAKAAGFDPAWSVVVQSDRAHFYPTQELMWMKLVADRKTRRVLGCEVVGSQGDAVKARVDALGTLLPYNVDLDAVASLETGHAPPYSASPDIVNNAANCLENILDGRQQAISAKEFFERFKQGGTRVLDVRSAVQAGPFVEKYGDRWINIPQEQIVDRMKDVPPEPFSLVCGSGPRSYESQLLLKEKGFANTTNIAGGIGMIKYSDSDFSPSDH